MRLLQLRGPGAYVKGLGHSIFFSFRLHGVSRPRETAAVDANGLADSSSHRLA
jgi:hypothetical protein